jgi:flagellar protein FlbT
MSGLVISLKPNERFLVNGALLMNGDKRSQICVPNDNVYVLRMSDALHPDEVDTPVKRVYYAVQIILSGDGDRAALETSVKSGLDALQAVFDGTPMSPTLEKAQTAFAKGRFYSVLYTLKSLFDIEAGLLDKNSVNAPLVSNDMQTSNEMAHSA